MFYAHNTSLFLVHVYKCEKGRGGGHGGDGSHSFMHEHQPISLPTYLQNQTLCKEGFLFTSNGLTKLLRA